jgi:peptide deformylase
MKIVRYPHPALRHRNRPLTSIDKSVRLQAGAMLELMYEARGLGLAAPQVALPYKMTVINVAGDATKKEFERILINPLVVERKGGLVEGEEGCLSFPDLYQKVRRFKNVVVQAYGLDGKAYELSAVDLEARLLQHEIDHLEGVLFIDKMGTIAKLASRGRLKEFERDYRKAQEKGDIPPDADILKLLDALEAGEPPPDAKPEADNQDNHKKPDDDNNKPPVL